MSYLLGRYKGILVDAHSLYAYLIMFIPPCTGFKSLDTMIVKPASVSHELGQVNIGTEDAASLANEGRSMHKGD